jgi:hypothetical protein
MKHISGSPTLQNQGSETKRGDGYVGVSSGISAFIAERFFVGEEEVAVPGKEISLWDYVGSEKEGCWRGHILNCESIL